MEGISKVSLQSERDFSSCSMGHSVGHKTDLITLTLSQCCDYDVVKMSSVKKKKLYLCKIILF